MKGLMALALAMVAVVTASPIFQQRQDLSYEYIVIGSGAGGGPLAARLARANHTVLLIESGDDQGKNHNYSVPGYQGVMTQDPKVAWNSESCAGRQAFGISVLTSSSVCQPLHRPDTCTARSQVHRRKGHFVPASWHSRRMYLPQRYDLDHSSRERLGQHRSDHWRHVLGFVKYAAVSPDGLPVAADSID